MENYVGNALIYYTLFIFLSLLYVTNLDDFTCNHSRNDVFEEN